MCECAGPVRGGLPVRAVHRRFARRDRRPMSQCGHVAGSFGVQHQPGGDPRRVARQKRLQHEPVQADRSRRRHRLQHRLPRQLVAERERRAFAAQHAGRQALIDRPALGGRQLAQQPGLCARPGHRGRVEHGAGRGRQASGARQHRVLNGGGNALHGLRCCREHLGDEERIACGLRVQGRCIDSGSGRERPHRRQRERLRRQPRRPGRCQIAEHGAQRMRRHDFVIAKARDEQRTSAGDAPAGIAQQVERRFVGPVDVLENGQRRPFGEQVDEGDEQAMPLAAAVVRDGQLAARVDGDVVERAERPRRCHRLAGAPVHRGVGAHRSGERSQHTWSCRCRLRLR